MKFSCEKYILQTAINTVSRAAAAKSPIPTLEGILVSATPTGVHLTGYDLKKGIYTTIAAEVKEVGSAVFNAKLFAEMIRRMPDGIIYIEMDEKFNTKIKCGRSEFSFIAMDSEEYPELPNVDDENEILISQKLLSKMINETLFAVSANESRPVYMGSLFEIENGVLTLVSVDGYRLALRRETIEGCDKSGVEFIVPGTALSDVQKICNDSDDKVSVCLSNRHVSFKIDETRVISRRLEGDFLNYKKSIPSAFRSTMKANRAEMLSIVDRVSIIVDEKIKTPIRITFGDGYINFLCATPVGRADDSCVCEGDGANTEIGFNDKYLRDALRAAPADEINICLNTGTSPCLIFPADESESFAYMILPVRLRPGE